MFFFPSRRRSKTTREMNSAENNEVRIPMINVVAKPRIGPVPKAYRIIPVSNVVTFASMMALFEFLYPSTSAALNPLPRRISSRIRSKISTLASTAIPIVKTIPAIPGSVNTAPKLFNIPKMKNMFTRRARFATRPAPL